MIIVMQSTKLNRETAKSLAEAVKPNEPIQRYPDISLQDCSDSYLTLLDIQADGDFQTTTASKLLADKLIQRWKMPESVKQINLVVADVSGLDDSDDVDIFASDLARALKEKHQRDVSVYIASVLECDYTLIVPPQFSKNKQNWELYGFNSSDIPRKKPPFVFNFSNLLELVKSKKLNPVWSGKDINTWLSRPDQAYKAYVPPARPGL